MNIVWIIAILLIGYICLYCLVDRICKCAEHCADIKAVGSSVQNMSPASLETIVKMGKN